MLSHPTHPLVLNYFCKRLGLTQDGAPEKSILLLLLIINNSDTGTFIVSKQESKCLALVPRCSTLVARGYIHNLRAAVHFRQDCC